MRQILDAINNGATGGQLASIKLPTTYKAAVLEKNDAEMFAGVASRDKDPRKSLKLREVPVPDLAPDEAVIAVMASSINFNTVWSSIFEPVSTFGSLTRLAKESAWAKRHDLPYHVVGSRSEEHTSELQSH